MQSIARNCAFTPNNPEKIKLSSMLKFLLNRGLMLTALAFVLLTPLGLYAQSKVVSGTVKSGPNEFVPGASVMEKGNFQWNRDGCGWEVFHQRKRKMQCSLFPL